MAEGRSLGVIAGEIRADWKPANAAAKPCIDAMVTLRSVEESYYHESGRDIVNRFLANAGTWRGETARRIKAELQRLLED
jgi:hypothetical protein